MPAAIFAAEHDTIVPAARTDALRASIGHLVFDQTIPYAGHNDIYARPEFPRAMQAALTALAQTGTRRTEPLAAAPHRNPYS